ncbi:MAG: hypothetical protein ACD_51C00037G0003 [uncultured bacterium]|nr:MAG: hypothetical protein ACD_51C00037G0003 [uncultured bacterium]
MDIYCDFNEDDELVFEAVAQPSEDLFIATLDQFQKWVKKMNKAAKDEASYLLQKMEGNHWVFQEDVHDEDEFDCAIVKVLKGKVYALSQDVMRFVKKKLKKFDISF